MTTSVNLRAARPDEADGAAFARLLDQAADGMFGTLLGRRSAEILGQAFTSPGHDLSFERVTVAESGGLQVGMVSGFSSEQHDRSTDAPLVRAAGVASARLWALGLVFSRLFDFMGRVPLGDWYLQAIAVDPSQRGAGIGTVLFDHAIETARTSGCDRLVLDVAVDNDGARRLYERLGMRIEATSVAPPFISEARVHRMVLDLAPASQRPTRPGR